MINVASDPRPLISVVTASLNARDELARTIASVVEQHNRNIEHIVIDGGSGDGTVALLEAAGDAVRWVSEPDDGIADALNKGVALARGEFVLILQAGDRLVGPDSLAQAAERLISKPDILACAVIFEERGSNRVWTSRGLGFRALFHMPTPHQGIFASRDLFARVGGFDPAFSITMDYDWLLRVRNAEAVVLTDPRPLAMMPDTGISSRRDWAGLRPRLEENRRAQFAHARGLGAIAALQLYWAVYPAYRRARCIVERLVAR